MKNRIAFDFDGVIADTSKKKIDWLLKNKNINISCVDKSSFFELLKYKYSLKTLQAIYKEMSDAIFTEKVLLETDPLENCIEVIKKLSTICDIYIISARTKESLEMVKKWLKINSVLNNISGVFSSSFERKVDICKRNNITFLCDDDIRHLIVDSQLCLVYYNELNNMNNISNIEYVTNWNDIERLVIKLYG